MNQRNWTAVETRRPGKNAGYGGGSIVTWRVRTAETNGYGISNHIATLHGRLEAKDDARLLAAAPDLHRALVDIPELPDPEGLTPEAYAEWLRTTWKPWVDGAALALQKAGVAARA